MRLFKKEPLYLDLEQRMVKVKKEYEKAQELLTEEEVKYSKNLERFNQALKEFHKEQKKVMEKLTEISDEIHQARVDWENKHPKQTTSE